VAPLMGAGDHSSNSSSWQGEHQQQQRQQQGGGLSNGSVELAASSSLPRATAHDPAQAGKSSRGGHDSQVQLVVDQSTITPSPGEVGNWQEAAHRRPKHDSSSSFAQDNPAADCLSQQQQPGLSVFSSSGSSSSWLGHVCSGGRNSTAWQACGVLLSPPMVGCWLSLVVGSAPPLKGLLWGKAPPLGWVQVRTHGGRGRGLCCGRGADRQEGSCSTAAAVVWWHRSSATSGLLHQHVESSCLLLLFVGAHVEDRPTAVCPVQSPYHPPC
jgi:hypothetical protein